MQIYVCVKHVPDSGALIELKGTSFAEDNVKFVVNPFDEYAIEEALQIVKDKGGEVVIVCLGKKGAEVTLRSALAMGPARAIHVVADEQFESPAVTARALAQAIKADGHADLVMTGKQSIDSEGMQTLYWLAKELDMPVVNEVVSLDVSGDGCIAKREIGGGTMETLAVQTPCVVGATKGLNEPRYPKLPDILKAKKKEIYQVPLSELSLDGAPTPSLVSLERMPERAGATFITGETVQDQAKELIRLLREEKNVI